MKRINLRLAAALAGVMLAAGAFAPAVSADWQEKGGNTYYLQENGDYSKGWTTIDGKEYYFKNSGVMLTKSAVIDGVRYRFSSDGVCQGKYTGWTKSAKGRRYWKNGVMCVNKWLKTKSGKQYYAGSDGYMRTGWTHVTRGEGAYSYFDENGVWDGKAYYTGYQPKDLYSFMQDFNFLASETYSYSTTNYSTGMKKIEDSEAFRELLSEIVAPDLNTPLLFDRQLSDDEVELNENIYYGGKAIKIKFLDKPGFEFTKDKEGNSYLYNASYGFGLKLKDNGAYDKIAELIG